MTKTDPDLPTGVPGARELADELRGILEALAVRSLREEDVAVATRLARDVREMLQGAPRARWYDAEADAWALSPEARRAYLEQSPIRGHLNPVAPPLDLETVRRPDGTRAVRGTAKLGMRYEGPPHGVHGGWVAALFDEMLGAVQGLAEAPGVTAVLTVRYRHLTPVLEDLRLDGWIHEQRGRRLVARATCHAGETLTAEAEALFIEVDFNEVQDRMMQRRLARDGDDDDPTVTDSAHRHPKKRAPSPGAAAGSP
jgi:acyl-coenzyme A thioesterase PaaI-like protein